MAQDKAMRKILNFHALLVQKYKQLRKQNAMRQSLADAQMYADAC
jgi:phage regulator Rha-like protein